MSEAWPKLILKVDPNAIRTRRSREPVSILQRFERFRKDLPAVHDNRLPSDIAGFPRNEEPRGVTDVFDGASRFNGIEAAMVLWYSSPSDSSRSMMMLNSRTGGHLIG
jgi:hypothetical protein